MLNGLLAYLKSSEYSFVTPTPLTHSRVIARPSMQRARDLRDVFGWSLPFSAELVPPEVLESVPVERLPNGDLRSRVRVSSYRGDLFVHSAYPTTAHDAVFFGPDSYRFADLIHADARGTRVLDIGTGSGIGAVAAGRRLENAQLAITDINPKALAYAAVNLEAAGMRAVELDEVDLAVINPPYIIDDAHRAYRDGGGQHGGAVGLAMVEAAMRTLAPRGRIILYTGSAIIDGHDPFREALETLVKGCSVRYRELDPDVFGEELEREAYANVDRIAVVAATIDKP